MQIRKGKAVANYLTIDSRRFSAAIMWSVELGIQRRTEGHNDFFVLGVAAGESISPAIVFAVKHEIEIERVIGGICGGGLS